ncbi:hypothetical protein ACU4GA_24260 [Methylobacterium oryzae CBMB20]
MIDDLTYFRDDLDEGETDLDRRGRRALSVETLAVFALEAAIPTAERRRIARAEDLRPRRRGTLRRVGGAHPLGVHRAGVWPTVHARSGAARGEDRPDRGNDTVAQRLSEGGRVLGISQDCGRYLPSALLAAADGRYRIGVPANAVLAQGDPRRHRAARARAAPSAAAGLGLWDLCAAIRAGSARACVDRLAAASRARSTVDRQTADAPPFATLRGFGAAHSWGTRLIDDLEAWRDGRIGSFEALDRNVILASTPGLGKSTYVRSLAKAAKLPLLISPVSSWFTQSNGYLDGVVK